ncbi:hypothetical protein [Microvirga brassicacearum]|uniref:Uncharacterized protein n=1 Tax=Microvirga brassicacearum TaxID=2580413 RepID=A0A5N3P756_9HYPH|nr:hypothetical protein [Microvirga brassicacearum]KAB0265568.1 hypothetical protein FEZ63_18035 [Microvirga brassicacearum]
MPNSPSEPSQGPDWHKLIEFARDLPTRLAAAYTQERKQPHNLCADQHDEAIGRMIDLLVGMWTDLAAAYPAGHFGGKDPEVFFREYLAGRLRWRTVLVWENFEDPIEELEVRRAVLSDAEDAVADIVAAIFRRNDKVMPGLWAQWWQKARAVRHET